MSVTWPRVRPRVKLCVRPRVTQYVQPCACGQTSMPKTPTTVTSAVTYDKLPSNYSLCRGTQLNARVTLFASNIMPTPSVTYNFARCQIYWRPKVWWDSIAVIYGRCLKRVPFFGRHGVHSHWRLWCDTVWTDVKLMQFYVGDYGKLWEDGHLFSVILVVLSEVFLMELPVVTKH